MERLEREWPKVSTQLFRLLAKRGVPSWVAEDIVQETAARLVASWDKVDPERTLGPYAATIALNLLTDHYRKLSQTDVYGELPEIASAVDVPSEVIARLEMREVATALTRISRPQRDALLVGLADGYRGVLPAPVRMMRLRARRALSRLVDRSAAVGAGVLARLRRLEDFAKTYLPQVTVAVNARLFFGLTNGALVGAATIGIISPGVNAAPVRTVFELPHGSVAAAARELGTTARPPQAMATTMAERSSRSPDGPAPFLDELDHEGHTERDYWVDLPGAGTGGKVTLETLFESGSLPADPTQLLGDKPSCSVTTSDNSIGVGCLHQGSTKYGVHVRNKHKTVFKPIN